MNEELLNLKTKMENLLQKIGGIRIIFFFIIVTIIAVSFWYLSGITTEVSTGEELAKKDSQEIERLTKIFESLSLEAQAVYVWDINRGKVLYAFNEEAQLPLASLTKLMTVLVASEFLSKNQVITVTANSLLEEGDSGLLVNERWLFSDLLDFTLLVSSNDGANVLASVAGNASIRNNHTLGESPRSTFIKEMNKKASLIGLTQTYFINETGLDSSDFTSGGYGSAKDIALLLEYIVQSDSSLTGATVYETLELQSIDNFMHTATNTNSFVGSVPGLIASKTGFTDLAGGNLVVAFDAGINRPIVIAVLGSTQQGRFEDVDKLVQATFRYLAN